MFRISGAYRFEIPTELRDYGHIWPVELLAADISVRDVTVSAALRHAIALRPRLYEITPYGGDVERLPPPASRIGGTHDGG